jgi:hypothetical protein
MSDPAEVNPNQSATGQPVLSATRWLLRGLCIIATFYSAFDAAHGILTTVQILNDEIPAGRIVAITGHSKVGPEIRLDSGREAVFFNQALYQQPRPIELKVGDQVEKRRDSLVYRVNGVALTDLGWVLDHWLLPLRLLVPLAVYLTAGTIYVLAYQRTPLGDCLWSDADPERPHRPRTRAGRVMAMLVGWLIVVGFETVAFACIAGCLSGIGKAVFG